MIARNEWCGWCPVCLGVTVREGTAKRVCRRRGRCEGVPLVEYDAELHATPTQRKDAA